jgi:hypothetical protein
MLSPSECAYTCAIQSTTTVVTTTIASFHGCVGPPFVPAVIVASTTTVP